jgi:hypothetical protein
MNWVGFQAGFFQPPHNKPLKGLERKQVREIGLKALGSP